MNNSIHERALTPEALDEKYAAFLQELGEMPRATKEDRDARIRWAKAHHEYDRFVVDIMNVSKNNYYEKLQQSLSKGKPIDIDTGIATKEGKGTDPIVLWKAIMEMIENYTVGGMDKKGIPHTTASMVGENYKHIANIESGKNDMQKRAFSYDIPERNRYHVLALVKRMKQIREEDGRPLENIIEEAISGSRHKFTKKEIGAAIDIVRRADLTVSLDQEITDGGMSKTTWGEVEADDTRTDLEKGMDLWNDASKSLLTGWKKIEATTTKRNRELLKAFLSKDLMIALKLDALNREEQKVYQDLLEPKCGSWCQRKKRCPYRRKDGCFIRFDLKGAEAPYGNEDIYEGLKEVKGLYNTVLRNDYVQYAYDETIKNLEDIYEKPLKPFQSELHDGSFLFTNAIMAKALGEGSDKISKYSKKYEGGNGEEGVRDILYKWLKSDD